MGTSRTQLPVQDAVARGGSAAAQGMRLTDVPRLLAVGVALMASSAAAAEQSGEGSPSAPPPAEGNSSAPSPDSTTVDGAECGRGVKKWVSLEFAGDWPDAVVDIVVQDLSAGLEADGMQACLLTLESQRRRSPVSKMRIVDHGDTVTIEVEDSLTNKRVARDVQVKDTPTSSEALVLAVAAEELLRATWAELSLGRPEVSGERRRRPSARPVTPPEQVPPSLPREPTVRPANSPDDRGVDETPPRDDSHALLVGFAMERMTGGLTLLGANLGYSVSLGERWMTTIWFGARKGLDQTTRLGQVDAEAAVGGVSVAFAALRAPRWRMGPEIAVQAAALHLAGRPGRESDGAAGWAPIAFARAGIQAGSAGTSLLWGCSLTAGAPLATFEATEDGSVVLAASGLELAMQLRGGVRF